jgi:predicted naringenin-chalcone synthase
LSYLLYISIANPESKHLQNDFVSFFTNSVEGNDEQIVRKINVVGNRSGIKERYSVIKDFSLSPEEFTFFPNSKSLLPEVSLSKRMELFKKEALKLSLKAVRGIPDFEHLKLGITHIITVTCTGLYAPGLDIELMRELGLNDSTKRASINFMGCNAAILALKQANDICLNDKNSKVLIVSTELCTIHFQKKYSDDYIISNSLFADGSAATIISGINHSISNDFDVLKMLDFNSLIAHEGNADMAWQITETGFMMNLSSYVSAIINEHLPKLLSALNKENITKWLVHPGGVKILDECQKTLGINKNDLEESYTTLESYGNMSSPTILFVIKKYLEARTEKSNGNVCALGFGPGLSIESVTFADV